MDNASNNSINIEFYESSDKINEFTAHQKLNVTPNFNFKNENFSNSKAKEIYQKAKKENDIDKKKNLLYESLKYNNTDGDIILEILKIEDNIEKKNEILKKYGYYLSNFNYIKYFNKDKKTPIELLKRLFELLENFQKNHLYCIETIWKFVEEYCLTKIRNTFANEITRNEELFIYFLILSKEISRLIYSKKYCIYYDDKLDFDEKLKAYFSISEQNEINELIKESKKNSKVNETNFEKVKYDLMYVKCKCFNSTFPNISNLIKELKNEITFVLDNLDDSNFYIFINIKELIINIIYDYDNSKNKEMIKRIKNMLINKNSNIKKDIINFNNKSKEIKIEEDKQNSNNFILKENIPYDFIEIFGKKKILKNAYIYDWEKIIKNISNLNINFHIPLEYQFLDFIKIKYQYKYNFINYSIGFIEELLLKICKSNTIISLLNDIYPGCEQIFNEKSSFLEDLIKKVLNRSFYLTIYSYRVGVSFSEIKRIYFYLYNRYNKSLDDQYNFKCFLVSNFGAFIYIFFHEFYGHFLLHYLVLLTTNKYNSPFSTVENGKESGRYIETKLFGKRWNILNFDQILFILDIDNYQKDYNTFCSNFKNCSKIEISKNLSDMFKKHFDVDINFNDNDPLEEINIFGNDIKENNNLVFINSNFNNCVPFNYLDFIYDLENVKKKLKF